MGSAAEPRRSPFSPIMGSSTTAVHRVFAAGASRFHGDDRATAWRLPPVAKFHEEIAAAAAKPCARQPACPLDNPHSFKEVPAAAVRKQWHERKKLVKTEPFSFAPPRFGLEWSIHRSRRGAPLPVNSEEPLAETISPTPQRRPSMRRPVLALLAVLIGLGSLAGFESLPAAPSPAAAAAPASAPAPTRSSTPAKATGPIKVLLLGDRTGHHRPEVFAKVLTPALAKLGIAVTFTRDIKALNSAEPREIRLPGDLWRQRQSPRRRRNGHARLRRRGQGTRRDPLRLEYLPQQPALYGSDRRTILEAFDRRVSHAHHRRPASGDARRQIVFELGRDLRA